MYTLSKFDRPRYDLMKFYNRRKKSINMNNTATQQQENLDAEEQEDRKQNEMFTNLNITLRAQQKQPQQQNEYENVDFVHQNDDEIIYEDDDQDDEDYEGNENDEQQTHTLDSTEMNVVHESESYNHDYETYSIHHHDHQQNFLTSKTTSQINSDSELIFDDDETENGDDDGVGMDGYDSDSALFSHVIDYMARLNQNKKLNHHGLDYTPVRGDQTMNKPAAINYNLNNTVTNVTTLTQTATQQSNKKYNYSHLDIDSVHLSSATQQQNKVAINQTTTTTQPQIQEVEEEYEECKENSERKLFKRISKVMRFNQYESNNNNTKKDSTKTNSSMMLKKQNLEIIDTTANQSVVSEVDSSTNLSSQHVNCCRMPKLRLKWRGNKSNDGKYVYVGKRSKIIQHQQQYDCEYIDEEAVDDSGEEGEAAEECEEQHYQEIDQMPILDRYKKVQFNK
jgi:hypothetical protein